MTESTNTIGLVERLDLAALKKLCEEATPGPWEDDGLGTVGSEWTADITLPGPMAGGLVCVFTGDMDMESPPISDCQASKDAAFIAASREALPKLIDALEAALRIMKPFAAWSLDLDDKFSDHEDDVIVGGRDSVVTFGDIRAARRFTQGDYR